MIVKVSKRRRWLGVGDGELQQQLNRLDKLFPENKPYVCYVPMFQVAKMIREAKRDFPFQPRTSIEWTVVEKANDNITEIEITRTKTDKEKAMEWFVKWFGAEE